MNPIDQYHSEVSLRLLQPLFQSSAKSLISDSISDEMLFMYKENNKGPRTVPWGTSDKTGAQSGFTPFTTTRCCLKQRKESINFNVLPPIP